MKINDYVISKKDVFYDHTLDKQYLTKGKKYKILKIDKQLNLKVELDTGEKMYVYYKYFEKDTQND